jgi:uncharacterized membrane protein
VPQFDFTELAIGGVALVWIIPRIVEFLKTGLNLSGTRNIWIVVFCLGLFFSGMAAAISEGLIPPVALPYIRVAMIALGGAVAACGAIGEFELQRKLRPSG